ncbi:hypothetical protein SAMN05443248_5072 [Bradyrhizobium erythrophlei]|uniref:Uncharacterized protein n=1 Tax=Bradyrhizobium erythrophlei TaxID=1437360 RepID=A0A1M5TLE4_9BRAD|nr:hypothetical protein SAMN05443248_5072 [Bradyrhizobium erythrophlei]
MLRSLVFLVSRTRCSVLHAAPQSRDLWLPAMGPGSAAHRYELRCVRGTIAYPSTVFPLLMTATLRAFTLASNEITWPSFHKSIVTVSPG